MNKTRVMTGINSALDSRLIEIESQISKGFTGIQLIGNTSEICRDGKERVRAALEKCNIPIPEKKIVVSLTPSDIKKDSNHFDLPIAISLAILLNKSKSPKLDCSRWLFASELGLSGNLKPVKGIVSLTLNALDEGLAGIIVSEENIPEIRALSKLADEKFHNFRILGFSYLKEIISFIFGSLESLPEKRPLEYETLNHQIQPNFDDMVLTDEQESIAACVATGLHSLILRGSPGTGKSMFAARLPSIFPNMNNSEQIEAMQIQSAFSEKISDSLLNGVPTFRSPHHSASAQAILGTTDRPGEISLAHGGILFLDEFPEFRRDLIESLREPLESGLVHVSRAAKKVTWKASFTLIAACNNCPCGWFGSMKKSCQCLSQKLINYRNKLSGPILDRMDIHFNMPEPKNLATDIFFKSAIEQKNGKSDRLKEKVEDGRDFSLARNKAFNVICNRDLKPKDMLSVSKLSEKDFIQLLEKYTSKSSSSRSLFKSIKVARTLADLDHSEKIREEDFHKAWSWQVENSAKVRGEMDYAYP